MCVQYYVDSVVGTLTHLLICVIPTVVQRTTIKSYYCILKLSTYKANCVLQLEVIVFEMCRICCHATPVLLGMSTYLSRHARMNWQNKGREGEKEM